MVLRGFTELRSACQECPGELRRDELLPACSVHTQTQALDRSRLPGETDFPPVPHLAMQTFCMLFARPAAPQTCTHVCAHTSVAAAARMPSPVSVASPRAEPAPARWQFATPLESPSSLGYMWHFEALTICSKCFPYLFSLLDSNTRNNSASTKRSFGGQKNSHPHQRAHTHTHVRT